MTYSDRFFQEFSQGGMPICNKHEEIEVLASCIHNQSDCSEVKQLAKTIMNMVACCRDDAINMENKLTSYKAGLCRT